MILFHDFISFKEVKERSLHSQWMLDLRTRSVRTVRHIDGIAMYSLIEWVSKSGRNCTIAHGLLF